MLASIVAPDTLEFVASHLSRWHSANPWDTPFTCGRPTSVTDDEGIASIIAEMAPLVKL